MMSAETLSLGLSYPNNWPPVAPTVCTCCGIAGSFLLGTQLPILLVSSGLESWLGLETGQRIMNIC